MRSPRQSLGIRQEVLNMNYRGVLFDFNGTLFFDSEKHKEAWQIFLPEKLGIEITEEEIRKNCLGQSNPQILTRYFGTDLSHSEIDRLAYEKEALYRSLCKKDEKTFHLVKGAEAYFDHLKELGIPFTIATGSEIENVKFYFEEFNIGRWFSLDRMVWDDGVIPSKPNPELYLRAAEKIGVPASECLIFEDSNSGVKAARNANAHAIVQLVEKDGDPLYEGTALTARDFTDIAAFDAL